MKRLLRDLTRYAYRVLVPSGSKNTIRQWLLLDEQDKPPEVIRDYSRGPVLVLAPHMDDEVIGCGGALRKHVLAGAQVTVVFLTDGRRGNPSLYRDPSLGSREIAEAEAALVEQRKRESAEAAEIIGVRGLIFLDRPDGELDVEPELVARVKEILEKVSPAVIYLPSLLDTHHDHWAANRIFFECLDSVEPASDGAPVFREYEVWTPLLVNRLVNIDDVVEVKRRALQAFASQIPFVDPVRVTLGLNSYRSIHVTGEDCRYAEAFFESTPEEYRLLFERFLERR